jgi:hypothetical protein
MGGSSWLQVARTVAEASGSPPTYEEASIDMTIALRYEPRIGVASHVYCDGPHLGSTRLPMLCPKMLNFAAYGNEKSTMAQLAKLSRKLTNFAKLRL